MTAFFCVDSFSIFGKIHSSIESPVLYTILRFNNVFGLFQKR
jgi:hypothetical protein